MVSFAFLVYLLHVIDGIQNFPPHVAVDNHHIENPFSFTLSPSYALNVLDYGAKGDKTTDNTKAFNNALHAAASNNSGGYVYVPSGQYLFEGSITIPTGVTLIGTYMFSQYHKASDSNKGIQWSDLTDGSILGSRKNYNSSFIIMKESSTIKGFTIYYPDQICAPSGKKPIVYPPTILTTGPQPAIMDLELINSYFGISASQNSARHYIARIYGGPIKRAIFIDDSNDNGRVENTHFKADWSCPRGTATTDYSATHGIAYVIGNTDNQYFFNTFCINYAICYNFISTGNGNDPSNAANGNFLGITTDGETNYSVKVDQTKASGISITNGIFVADKGPGTQIYISDSNNGAVHLTGCTFFGADQYIAQIYGNSSTSFDNCQFQKWDKSNPAIMSNNGIVKLISNNFYQDFDALLKFKSGTKKAIVVGNTFEGKYTIQADNGVEVAQFANL